MVLLAVDTSTRFAGVAAMAEGRAVAEHVWRSEQNHGRELMPAIIEVLRQVGATPGDVTHVAAALGPGGFSALRVGISTAIGLALPRGLPVAGVSTFEIEAAPFYETASAESPVYALIPAGRGELAWSRYESPGGARETGLATPEALVAQALPGARFCGEGAQDLAGLVGPSRLLGGPPPTRSPAVLARLARERFEAGQGATASTLQPIYARQPSITKPRPPVA